MVTLNGRTFLCVNTIDRQAFLKKEYVRYHLQSPMRQLIWTCFLRMLLDRPNWNKIKGMI